MDGIQNDVKILELKIVVATTALLCIHTNALN